MIVALRIFVVLLQTNISSRSMKLFKRQPSANSSKKEMICCLLSTTKFIHTKVSETSISGTRFDLKGKQRQEKINDKNIKRNNKRKVYSQRVISTRALFASWTLCVGGVSAASGVDHFHVA